MQTILYVGAASPGGDPLGLLATSGGRRMKDGAVAVGAFGGDHERRFYATSDPASALLFVRERAVDALVIDTRVSPFSAEGPNPSQDGPFARTRAGEILAGLYPDGRLFAGMMRDRVIGIVGEGPGGVDAAYHFGANHIGAVLASPSRDQVIGRLEGLLGRHRAGRIALCLAGGGIEGLLYELGVLRALNAFLVDRSVVDFDLFCGISAGAVIGSFLANGVGPDEVARGLAGSSARFDPITRLDLFDPNFRELGTRTYALGRELLRGGGGPRGMLSSISRAIPSAAFAGDRFRSWLERQLNKPGMSDRFDALRRPLFVGATDQDTSEAVVFGEESWKHVPIHRAVRASAALIPFYAPEKIDGRRFIDGAFSRTTNMRVAVRQGGTLVILVDPLVPVFSKEAGYVYSRGGMFGTMQGLKALINGRFDKAVHAIAEMFPDVSFWLIKPEAEEMRILSGSPMKYFYRREVEEIAYHNTVRKLRQWLPELSRDFARHGVLFRDPDRADDDLDASVPFEPGALGAAW